MPATPAWPPKSLVRLFVGTPLSAGARIELDPGQANYLGNVMRLGLGAELLVFDGESGEWQAQIADTAKKRMSLVVQRKTREAEIVPDVWLAFAPVKRAQTDWLVEKATEIGAARLVPVITERTTIERVKLERLRSITIEAAEQCRRTRLPELSEPLPLKSLLKGDPNRRIYFADENGGEPAVDSFARGPALILIGPEGGFTDHERELIREAPNSTAITLGPRILRAETAALASLAAYMAVAGDWRSY